MATLTENVAKVAAARDAIAAAIEEKGVAVPEGTRLSELPDLVRDLEWREPEEWPDLRAELAADAEDYPGKVFILYENMAPGTPLQFPNSTTFAKITVDGEETARGTQVPFPASKRFVTVKLYLTGKTVNGNGLSISYSLPFTYVSVAERRVGVVPRWVVANGMTYTTGYTGWLYAYRDSLLAIDGITWDKTGYLNNRSVDLAGLAAYRLPKVVTGGVVYGSLGGTRVRRLDVTVASPITDARDMFSGLSSLESVPETLDLSECTAATNLFKNCQRIRKVPDVLDLSKCTAAAQVFHSCYELEAVPDVLDVSGVADLNAFFYGCRNLRAVPEVLDLSSCTNAANLFCNCANLARVPEVLDLSKCTNCSYVFQQCGCLKRVPDVLDLSSATTTLSMFASCPSLEAVPTHLTANGDNNLAIAFPNSNNLSKESIVAMAGNLNDLTGSAKPPTVSFNSTVRAKFTDGEWAEVKAKFDAKGWNLSPAT